MRATALALSLSSLAASTVAGAQQAFDEQQAVEIYQGPTIAHPGELNYPSNSVRRGREGWVELNYMVDTEGRAYEITVLDNVGRYDMVDSAIRYIRRTRFEPARLGDRLVDSSDRRHITFRLLGAESAATEEFVELYRAFMTALEQESRDDMEVALRALEESEIRFNREFAYLNLAKYHHARLFGTPLDQMQHLQRALGESISRPDEVSVLGEEALSARRALAQLQAQNSYFAEALNTLGLMQLKGDDEGLEIFRELTAQLLALRENEDPYAIAGSLNDRGSWSIQLFRDSFYIADSSGRIDELKLRCERGYVFFEFDENTQYDIASGDGWCRLEVIGDPQATFTLVQS